MNLSSNPFDTLSHDVIATDESDDGINSDNVIPNSREHSLHDRLVHKINKIRYKVRRFRINLLNYRIFRITLLHWTLLLIWVSLLIKFTSIYREFYTRTKLFATMSTNILLFGVSDILAQSISCFFMTSIDPIPQFIDDANSQIVHNVLSHTNSHTDNESDNYSIFNEYGVTPVTSHESNLSSNEGSPFDYEDPFSAKEAYVIFNFWRWLCFMGWGAFVSNFQVPWYKILNFFFTQDPSMIQVFERVLCDQLLYSPIFLFFFFTYSNFVMEGGDGDTLRIKIQKVYLSTLGCNLIVWPMAQIINFAVMPKHLQVPFSSSVGVLWNCFLSMRNSSNSL
ncbi:hypothetical protein MOUN0_L01706 [Monosporozyma unispora]|nr:hypothetical protein C6P44_005115 [Kazachstania unispora]